MNKLTSWLGLFSSFGTLLCCAIPSLLVALGLGAALAGIIGNFPFLTWPSENKGVIFITSFVMLSISFYFQVLKKNEQCPIDKKQACESAKSWSRPIFYITLGINIIGVFFAYVYPKFFT